MSGFNIPINTLQYHFGEESISCTGVDNQIRIIKRTRKTSQYNWTYGPNGQQKTH